jgi:hypothetical protein
MHSRFGKYIKIKMAAYNVLFAIVCDILNQKLLCIQKRSELLLTPSLGLSDLPAKLYESVIGKPCLGWPGANVHKYITEPHPVSPL